MLNETHYEMSSSINGRGSEIKKLKNAFSLGKARVFGGVVIVLIDKYLTEYDEDLTGDVYVDPLGVQIIWSAFGQRIFQNKVNSISNDVRNYTLNLLNHTVIKSLIDDDSVLLKRELVRAIGEKTSLQFKQACLVYLENIFTFSVSNPEVPEGVESFGVLGSSKARKLWDEENENPEIYFSSKEQEGNQRYHLLVRQLGLGVSGRYKTPFSQIGFFSNQYDYYSPGAEEVWSEVDALLKKSELLREVFERSRNHLIWLFDNKTQMPPKVCFNEVPGELVTAYHNALPNQATAGQETREFWLKVTHLDKGAAGALLKELEKHMKSSNEDLHSPELFESAKKRCVESEGAREARKLSDIQIIEPFLAELDLLFCIARHRKKHTIEDVLQYWEKLGRNSETLRSLATEVEDTPSLKNVVNGTALNRLNQLLLAASQNSLEEQLRELLNYHKKVMRVRGQQPWVEMTDTCVIKTHARTTKLPERSQRPDGGWVNSYYIPQFRNLVEGFRGVIK